MFVPVLPVFFVPQHDVRGVRLARVGVLMKMMAPKKSPSCRFFLSFGSVLRRSVARRLPSSATHSHGQARRARRRGASHVVAGVDRSARVHLFTNNTPTDCGRAPHHCCVAPSPAPPPPPPPSSLPAAAAAAVSNHASALLPLQEAGAVADALPQHRAAAHEVAQRQHGRGQLFADGARLPQQARG